MTETERENLETLELSGLVSKYDATLTGIRKQEEQLKTLENDVMDLEAKIVEATKEIEDSKQPLADSLREEIMRRRGNLTKAKRALKSMNLEQVFELLEEKPFMEVNQFDTDDGKITARDINGDILWEAWYGGEIEISEITGKSVVVRRYRGHEWDDFIAHDLTTGNQVWHLGSFHSRDRIKVDHGLLIQEDKKLTMLDYDSGKEKWQRGIHRFGYDTINKHGEPKINVVDNKVIVLENQLLSVVDLEKGSDIWSKKVHPIGMAATKNNLILLEGGHDYYGPYSLNCYDLRSGDKKWGAQPLKYRSLGDMVELVADDETILLSVGNQITSVLPESGETVWKNRFDYDIYRSSLGKENVYCIGKYHYLHALDKDSGKERWTVSTSGAYSVEEGEYVSVLGRNGALMYTLDPLTGNKVEDE